METSTLNGNLSKLQYAVILYIRLLIEAIEFNGDKNITGNHEYSMEHETKKEVSNTIIIKH